MYVPTHRMGIFILDRLKKIFKQRGIFSAVIARSLTVVNVVMSSKQEKAFVRGFEL